MPYTGPEGIRADAITGSCLRTSNDILSFYEAGNSRNLLSSRKIRATGLKRFRGQGKTGSTKLTVRLNEICPTPTLLNQV